ncbi:hypothetical protein GCG54_00003796 [Colletotrichum gloeosporioides]|uniref:GPI inositol-deacylase n=1 Tax=Colletotrichum gloeosporioides TaxID=474922 RepID=A0A8H4FHF5_COLGL|nr:uncharacterized protein GCG54_00003796 [Colletotrichum gloeosporioides]KAF3802337.1 hypothetical protein GCG54_00003796 [Colletotrichum gloeosporioides]
MRKATGFSSIIFVHGPISDFHHEDFQASQRNIRMFFYNYDSYCKKDAVRLRLMTPRNEILEDIHRKVIVSETYQGRYLIFVAHSHGGLVVKLAFIQAKISQRSLQIVDRTKIILFLGTTHQGTSIGTWGWILAQALRPLGSNPLILADSGYDGFPLQD